MPEETQTKIQIIARRASGEENVLGVVSDFTVSESREIRPVYCFDRDKPFKLGG